MRVGLAAPVVTASFWAPVTDRTYRTNRTHMILTHKSYESHRSYP
jgi:hypothetical protein